MDHETYAARIAHLARAAAAHPIADVGGSVRGDIRRWLYRQADGKCALCGTMTVLDGSAKAANYANVSHLISLSDSKAGFMPGLVFNGCRACNEATEDRDLTRYLHLFADVFSIPDAFPTRGEMAADRAKRDDSDESAKRRKALGFDF